MTFPELPLPDDDDERHAVFVSTAIPVPLDVAPLDDERAPEGSVLGTFIGARLIARCAMPREAIDQLMSLRLFDQPVPLALLAVEEDPGIQARLFALVPSERIIEAQQESEGARKLTRLAEPLVESDAVANYVRQEIARGDLTIGEPLAEPVFLHLFIEGLAGNAELFVDRLQRTAIGRFESPFAVFLSDDNVHVGYYSDLGILVHIPKKAQDLAHS